MEFYEGDNIGGISALALIEHFNVKSINPLVLVPGKGWKDIPFKDQTGQMLEKSDDSDNGTIYSYGAKVFVHNQRNEVDLELNPFIGQVAIAKVIDMNGRTRIIGSPDAPINFQKSADSGQRYVSENGTEFTFKIEQSFPAPAI
jgi:hypothetical protein